MNCKLPSIAIFASLISVQIVSFAQNIPPACQVTIDAYKACIENTIEFTEISDTVGAAELKRGYDPVAINRQNREYVAEIGELEAAKACASKEVRQLHFNNLTGMVTPLRFTGALKPACAKAYQRYAQILRNLD